MISQFINGLKEQNKEKIEYVITQSDSLWRTSFANLKEILDKTQILDQMLHYKFEEHNQAKDLHEVLKRCEHDIQYSYEFSLLLRFLLNTRFETKKYQDTSYLLLKNLHDAVNQLVNKSKEDIDLYNLDFLSPNRLRTRHLVLGKDKKPSKKYPTIPSSVLMNMSIRYWDSDAITSVPYLNPKEKKALKVCRNANQQLTRNNQKIPANSYFYALSPKGGLYIYNPQNDTLSGYSPDNFHHSSFRAGQPVVSAGFIKVGPKGDIVRIDTMSGHYRPLDMQTIAKHTLLACLILKEQNIIDDNCEVKLHGFPGYPKLGEILNGNQYSDLLKECYETLKISNPTSSMSDKVEPKLEENHSHTLVFEQRKPQPSHTASSQTNETIYSLTWEDFSDRINNIKPLSQEGYLTNGAYQTIEKFMKENNKTLKTEMEKFKRLEGLAQIIMAIQIDNIKNIQLKQFILDFRVAYNELPKAQQASFIRKT